MRIVLKLLLSTLAVLISGYILDPHVQVDTFGVALLVAALLSLLHVTLKPLLVILTIPFTLVTFGLFLWVINAAMTLLADYFIGGFSVDGFWWAVLFSFILAILVSILHKLVPEKEN